MGALPFSLNPAPNPIRRRITRSIGWTDPVIQPDVTDREALLLPAHPLRGACGLHLEYREQSMNPYHAVITSSRFDLT